MVGGGKLVLHLAVVDAFYDLRQMEEQLFLNDQDFLSNFQHEGEGKYT